MNKRTAASASCAGLGVCTILAVVFWVFVATLDWKRDKSTHIYLTDDQRNGIIDDSEFTIRTVSSKCTSFSRSSCSSQESSRRLYRTVGRFKCTSGVSCCLNKDDEGHCSQHGNREYTKESYFSYPVRVTAWSNRFKCQDTIKWESFKSADRAFALADEIHNTNRSTWVETTSIDEDEKSCNIERNDPRIMYWIIAVVSSICVLICIAVLIYALFDELRDACTSSKPESNQFDSIYPTDLPEYSVSSSPVQPPNDPPTYDEIV